MPPAGRHSEAVEVRSEAVGEPTGYFCNERAEVAALVPPTTTRILDVGCGAGVLGAKLRARQPCAVTGIERDPVAAGAARNVLDRVVDLDLDLAMPLPFATGAFDCVVCADVLEHLRDPARLLAEFGRVVEPGGILVASIPNVRNSNVLLPLLVLGRWQYEDAGVLDHTHLRFFTRVEAELLLAQTGWRIVRIDATAFDEHPVVPALAAVVGAMGGDAERFRAESSVLQFLIVATR